MARTKYPAAYCTHFYPSGDRCKNKTNNNVRLCHHHVKQLGVSSTDSERIRNAQFGDYQIDHKVWKHLEDTWNMCDYCECRGIAYSSPTADICWACATMRDHTKCNDPTMRDDIPDTTFQDDEDEMDVFSCEACRIEIATDIRLVPTKHDGCKISSAVFTYNQPRDSWEQSYV